MEYNICKFCGKKLKICYFDHCGSSFYCTCDGMKKYSKLTEELQHLNKQVDAKRDEIRDFLKENSLYNKVLAEINVKQRELNCYEECNEWREN